MATATLVTHVVSLQDASEISPGEIRAIFGTNRDFGDIYTFPPHRYVVFHIHSRGFKLTPL